MEKLTIRALNVALETCPGFLSVCGANCVWFLGEQIPGHIVNELDAATLEAALHSTRRSVEFQ